MDNLQKAIEEVKAVNAKQADITKSHTYELLCEILGLCLETDIACTISRKGIVLGWNCAGGINRVYTFTLNDDTTELEKAKQDLINYKIKEKI